MRSLLLSLLFAAALWGQSQPPLQLAGAIPLPGIDGRIDHLSIDVKNRRLFVAVVGDGTVEVADIDALKVVHRITGLNQPQGIVYVPPVNRLYVASGGDGSLRIFDGSSFKLLKTIAYGQDADNVRYDASRKWIYTGYGEGALGAIDLNGKKTATIKLDAHPESLQIEKSGARIFVNLPDSRKIAVINPAKAVVEASWTTDDALENFPMALDETERRLFVVCRTPARMLVLDTASGKVVASLPAVEDSDDVFYDQARKRIYASGGAGAVWVYQEDDPDHYRQLARITTVRGARTSLFSSELDRLFVAVRQQPGNPSEIRIYQPK